MFTRAACHSKLIAPASAWAIILLQRPEASVLAGGIQLAGAMARVLDVCGVRIRLLLGVFYGGDNFDNVYNSHCPLRTLCLVGGPEWTPPLERATDAAGRRA